MSATWVTNDGKVLQVAWMDSQHLVNSVNMVMRKNQLSCEQVMAMRAPGPSRSKGTKNFIAMRDEIHLRGLLEWSQAPGQHQLVRLDTREDFKTMCLLRAILDVQPKNWQEIIGLFQQNPASYLEHVLSCADPKWTPVVAKFAEYRLAPPEQWR